MTPTGYATLASLFTASYFEPLSYDLDVLLHDTLFDLDVILNLPPTGLPLYIGTQQVQKVYVGNNEVIHMYLGSTKIY